MIWLHPLASRVVHLLALASIRGCVFLAAAWLLSALMRRASSAARHMVWTLAMGAILMLPILAVVLPSWRVAVGTGHALGAIAQLDGGPAHFGPSWEMGDHSIGATDDQEDRGDLILSSLPTQTKGVTDRDHPSLNPIPAQTNLSPADSGFNVHTVWLGLFFAWLLGVAGVGSIAACGLVSIWKKERNATLNLDGGLHEMKLEIQRQLHIRRGVRLLVAPSPCMPVAWGIMRPTILLPFEAIVWPTDQQRSVLTHELAHVKRGDCAIQWLALFATAVYWFNPLVWLAEKRMRLERERACDDIVLSTGAAESDYAQCLVALARQFATRSVQLAGVAMARQTGLGQRVNAILDRSANRAEFKRRYRIVALIAFVLAVIPLSAIHLTRRASSSATFAKEATSAPAALAGTPPAAPTTIATTTAVTPSPPTTDSAAAAAGTISVDTDFECGTPMHSHVISPTHVELVLDESFQLDWWMCRLTGVAGKTVTIDVTVRVGTRPSGFSMNTKGWRALTPVYGTAMDLDDPATFSTGPVKVDCVAGPQTALIPDTKEQKWHFITNSAVIDDHHFTMTQSFTTDSVYIANHVPYPPGYGARFIESISSNPLAKVIDVGTTHAGRPLRIVEIGANDQHASQPKPCALLAAGEQAYQPDGKWACQGCIEFLLGDSDSAKKLREQYDFLIIPTLDPDGAAETSSDFVASFSSYRFNIIALQYARWLEDRVQAGGRIDLLLELHSLQSGGRQHMELWYLPGNSPERTSLISDFEGLLRKHLARENLIESQPHRQIAIWQDSQRFMGYVAKEYGALSMVFTVNSQAPVRHLTISQMKDIGRVLAECVGDYFASADGTQLLANVNMLRSAHEAIWKNNPATQPSQNIFEAQQAAEDENYMKTVAHSNPNAATRPVDLRFEVPLGGARLINGQPPPPPVDLPIYQKARMRMVEFARFMQQYAGEHNAKLPPDLGSLLKCHNADPAEIARDCLTPGDEARLTIPKLVTADWINQNSSYIFLAGGADVGKLTAETPESALRVRDETVMLHTRLDQPFHYPRLDDVTLLVYLDGHGSFWPVDAAKQIIEKSNQTLKGLK